MPSNVSVSGPRMITFYLRLSSSTLMIFLFSVLISKSICIIYELLWAMQANSCIVSFMDCYELIASKFIHGVIYKVLWSYCKLHHMWWIPRNKLWVAGSDIFGDTCQLAGTNGPGKSFCNFILANTYIYKKICRFQWIISMLLPSILFWGMDNSLTEKDHMSILIRLLQQRISFVQL